MNKKRKILHVLGGVTFQGGCGRVVSDICSWPWVDYEHGVMVHASFSEPAPPSCTLLRTGKVSRKTGSILYDAVHFLSEYRALKKAVAQFRPSLLHAHTRIGMIAAARIGRLQGLPVLMHMHFLGRQKWLYKKLLASPGAGAVANSMKTIEYYGIQDLSSLVYPAVRWPSQPERHQDRSIDCCRFVTASDISPVKKIDVMIEAFSRLEGGGIPRRLLVFGARAARIRGQYEKAVLVKAGALENVEVRGWTPDWRDELKEGDVYVHLSSMDTFGLSLLEAFSAGMLLVVSKNTFLRELAGTVSMDGVYQVDDDTPEAVCSALRDAGSCHIERARLWELRRAVASKFSHESGRQALGRLYTAAMSKTRSR